MSSLGVLGRMCVDVTWSVGQLTLYFPSFFWLAVTNCFMLWLWLVSMGADVAYASRGSVAVFLLLYGDEVKLPGFLDR